MRRSLLPLAALAFAAGSSPLIALSAVAADLDSAVIAAPDVLLPVEGVPCNAPIVQSFPSVWLGHFTGGYSHYTGPGGVIVTDWRDEKLCFPARQACDRFVHVMRQDYHRPEGYFTCLPIR